MDGRDIELYHAPQTRSTGVRLLFAELGVEPLMHLMNRKTDDQHQPAFLAINPMGKVPAIRHRGAVVTEQVAIFIYLADLFPEAGLAPGLGDDLRGPYLRWLAFYAGCFEPAAIDRALKREPGGRAMSPYGDWETTLAALTQQLRPGPFLLGERYTAADVLWGTALSWMTRFGIVPGDDVIGGYLGRFEARSQIARVTALDAADAVRLAG